MICFFHRLMYINLIHYVSGTGSVPIFWLAFSKKKKKLEEASLKTTYPVPEKYYAKFPYVRPELAKFNLTGRAQNYGLTRRSPLCIHILQGWAIELT